MVKLRTPAPKKSKKAFFVYDNKKPEDANYLGTYDEYGNPVIRTIKADVVNYLGAVSEKNKLSLPTNEDIITPHLLKVHTPDGVKNAWWFSYVSRESAEKLKREQDAQKEVKKEEEKKVPEKEGTIKEEQAPIPPGNT
jgi:hypothetical protein